MEAGYDNFRIGALIHDTRMELGMTQEELAEKVGTTKSYISKIENNLKETRISTLQKIVELGFGGRLELSIKIWFSLLEELKVRFEIGEKDETLLSEEDFYKKIDKSIEQAESGKTTNISKDKQREFLGLWILRLS